MAKYKLTFKKSVAKDLRAIPKKTFAVFSKESTPWLTNQEQQGAQNFRFKRNIELDKACIELSTKLEMPCLS